MPRIENGVPLLLILRMAGATGTLGAKPVAQDTAERRQLAVMFCYLTGSTALSAMLDQ